MWCNSAHPWLEIPWKLHNLSTFVCTISVSVSACDLVVVRLSFFFFRGRRSQSPLGLLDHPLSNDHTFLSLPLFGYWNKINYQRFIN
jgi:hypothetical protein